MSITPLSPSLTKIEQNLYAPETEAASDILKKWDALNLNEAVIAQQAEAWVRQLREKPPRSLSLESFFAQYPLSSQEGLNLMALAEAVLRIPDKANLNQLIGEKIQGSNWQTEGSNTSWLMGIATWGLKITQSLNLTQKLSMPAVRSGIKYTMKWLGQTFIMGKNIDKAITRGKKGATLCSFDMLGEAALTEADAERYFQAYLAAISAIKAQRGRGALNDQHSISVKLSALYPRYEYTQQARCIPALSKRLLSLAQAAKDADIPLTVDAEEARRLTLSLQIFENVYRDPALEDWEGLGLAIQAYLRATLDVIEHLNVLSCDVGKQIPVRLVKGAYWDSEIKEAQIHGLDEYPVWTRKAMSDVHYIVCAHALLESPKLYPQFATHNALTLATLLHIKANRPCEVQSLHGMGERLYALLRKDHPNLVHRIYAPVGEHETLLPYLVRRLLENGASASFVNQVLHPNVTISSLSASPRDKLTHAIAHPKIPKPTDLFAPRRQNARGLDLNEQANLKAIETALNACVIEEVAPQLIKESPNERATLPILNPASTQKPLSTLHLASKADVEEAILQAKQAHSHWQQTPTQERSAILERAADLLEASFESFVALCVLEAGKLWQDGVDEVRETIDFLRYYASEAKNVLAPQTCPGPTGELNQWIPQGRGVFLCISPWNFPLAIFTGQVAAALVTGNCVLAKPATQTAHIAYCMVNLLHQAGIPKNVLQSIPGNRSVIGTLLSHPHLSGLMLTGSTHTALAMNKILSDRPHLPFVAETGGQNAMIVDSTAHPEQAVMDIVQSAFQSAGQRCSALRVVFLQEEIADRLLSMIQGAMDMLNIGDPQEMSTDVGPVIDGHALKKLEEHIAFLHQYGFPILHQCKLPEQLSGFFFPPTLVQIHDIQDLPDEVFGPILHVVRYRQEDLSKMVGNINATGYGLTLGVHSRLASTIDHVRQHAQVGNLYINRNMIGAVVGVQPFGGKNLSGTGPKAGGPWYLQRLCTEMTVSNNTAAIGGNASLMSLEE